MALHLPVQALGALGVCTAVAVCTVHVTKSTAQSTKEEQLQAGTEADSILNKSNCVPIYALPHPPQSAYALATIEENWSATCSV
jgi:hypothetical protein